MFTLTLLSIPWWVSIHRICTIPGWLRTWQQQKGGKKRSKKNPTARKLSQSKTIS
jgi:hypothetical protein